jgi:hypothetical protein
MTNKNPAEAGQGLSFLFSWMFAVSVFLTDLQHRLLGDGFRVRHSVDGLFELRNNLLKFFDFLFLDLGKLYVIGCAVKQAVFFFAGDFCKIPSVFPKRFEDFTMQRAVVTSGAQSKRFLDFIRDTYGCVFHDTILLPKWYQCKVVR